MKQENSLAKIGDKMNTENYNKKKLSLQPIKVYVFKQNEQKTMNTIPQGIVMKRDLTTKEARHVLEKLMGFDLGLTYDDIAEYDDSECRREERESFEEAYTNAINDFIQGKCDFSYLCNATQCYDDDGEGLTLACSASILEYLIKKEII